jgi:hypothetical protein
MCLQDIKIAQSQEIRGTVVSAPSAATTPLAGVANNRVGVRFALTSFIGAVGNLNVIIQYLLDSTPIGIGFLSSGTPYVDIFLEDLSHIVKSKFQCTNNSGFTVSVGVSEILQNTNPADAL